MRMIISTSTTASFNFMNTTQAVVTYVLTKDSQGLYAVYKGICPNTGPGHQHERSYVEIAAHGDKCKVGEASDYFDFPANKYRK